MSFEPAIRLASLSKCYHIYATPRDRLLQMLWRGRRRFFREFWALRDVTLEVMPGEVVGVIGSNGSGKSTLLQLVCGTLNPSSGKVAVRGRVAALLELGAGFNPEFTGRENVFLSAAVMGLSQREIAERYEGIVDFSGIRDFIDQPVKTYSSGMYVRLAFAVAISVDPDILVIDEALSVGDGEFARKSFDRIMALKKAGKTILFCSHSMYQVEAICNRAVWLDKGRVAMAGPVAAVTSRYLDKLDAGGRESESTAEATAPRPDGPKGTARIVAVEATVDGRAGRALHAQSMESDLAIRVRFSSDPLLAPPGVAIGISTLDGRGVSSVFSCHEGVVLSRQPDGSGAVEVVFPALPLLKGEYTLSVFLGCEQGIHCYDQAIAAATLTVSQSGLEQGLVMLPHHWRTGSGKELP
ncbi:MAG: ABC transporter ATP-binding protein [Thermodesulfobacteriota bacterium]